LTNNLLGQDQPMTGYCSWKIEKWPFRPTFNHLLQCFTVLIHLPVLTFVSCTAKCKVLQITLEDFYTKSLTGSIISGASGDYPVETQDCD